MPVFNAMPFLPLAVNSILAQTRHDLEFIILDDGSTDEGPSYIESLRDSRIKFVRGSTNIGYTRRIIEGIGLAQAPYIARQDADDISSPDRLAKQLDLSSRHQNLVAVGSAFQYIDVSGVVESITSPPTLPNHLRDMLYYTNPLCHGSMLMRRAALDAVGGYDATFEPAEDYELWNRFAARFDIGAASEVLYQMRIYPTSVTGTRRIEQRRSANKARIQALSRCKPAELSARALALHHFSIALHEISEGRILEGHERLRLAANADMFLEEAHDHLISMAINLAVELGPSGRTFVKTEADEQVARSFLRILFEQLPPGRFDLLRRDLFAEYHAACAYLYSKQRRPWRTMYHLLSSWKQGPRHRRNRGLIKMMLRSF